MPPYPVPRAAHDDRAMGRGRQPGRHSISTAPSPTTSHPVPDLRRALRRTSDWAMTQDDYDRHLLGHSDREIVEKALGWPGSTRRSIRCWSCKRRYRELVAHDSPIAADTVALVGVLADHGVPMAIVTGAQRDDVRGPGCQPGRGGDHRRRRRGGRPPWQARPGGFRGAALLGREPTDVLVFGTRCPGYGARWRPACAASPSAPRPATRCGRWPRPWFRGCPQACSTPCCRGCGIGAWRAGDGDTGLLSACSVPGGPVLGQSSAVRRTCTTSVTRRRTPSSPLRARRPSSIWGNCPQRARSA